MPFYNQQNAATLAAFGNPDWGLANPTFYKDAPANSPVNQYIMATDPYYYMPPEQYKQWLTLNQQGQAWEAAHPSAANRDSQKDGYAGPPQQAQMASLEAQYTPSWAKNIQQTMGSTNDGTGLQIDPKTGQFYNVYNGSNFEHFMDTAIPMLTMAGVGAAFAPAIAGMLGGTEGAVGGSTVGGIDLAGAPAFSYAAPAWEAGAATGAANGAISSGLTGGNVLKGAATGALSGGVGGGISQLGIPGDVSSALGGGTIGNLAGNAAQSAVQGGASAALHGGNIGTGVLGGAAGSLANAGAGYAQQGIGDLMASTAQPGGVSDTYTKLNGVQGADFSSSMPTAADLQNPNLDLTSGAPGPLSLSGNNMSSNDPFGLGSVDLTGLNPDLSNPLTNPNYFDPGIYGGTTPMSGPSNGMTGAAGNPLTDPNYFNTGISTTGGAVGGYNFLDPSLPNFQGPSIDPTTGQPSTPAPASWGSKLLSQLGIGKPAAGSKGLSPLQQIAALAGLTGIVGSALGGSNTNQTPNYQNIPGSAIGSYGSGAGGGYGWGNYGYQPRTQNAAMNDPKIDWSHYGEQSQANKPGGGVFFTPTANAPINAAFGPSQQQPVTPQPIAHAQGGRIGPLDELAAMAPMVAAQNHVSNMNPPAQHFAMGGQTDDPSAVAPDGGPEDINQPQMGPRFGPNLRGPMHPQPLTGVGNLRPGQMPMTPNGGYGSGMLGNVLGQFGRRPMFGDMGRPQHPGWMNQHPGDMGEQQPPQPWMGFPGQQPSVHGAMGLNPGAMPMQADPGSQLNMPQQQPYMGAIGAAQAMADGGSTSSNPEYTGNEQYGGGSYWQAVKDRLGELVGPHHVGTGAADKAAGQLENRGKQVDDAVAANDHAQGGEIMGPLQHFSGHGYVQGPGDGQSDDIPAKLSNGEYVISADVVSALGNGSNEVGANKLDAMMQNVRKSVSKNHAKGELQPKAKDPHAYLGKG